MADTAARRRDVGMLARRREARRGEERRVQVGGGDAAARGGEEGGAGKGFCFWPPGNYSVEPLRRVENRRRDTRSKVAP